jgi:protein arginine N-methyltransferase 1
MEYSLFGYGSMIRDSVRMGAYARALERAVKPGAVVLDLGTGTGILALLAARAGAEKVIAVDPSELIEVARETARANGLADRIEFRQGNSTQLDLAERPDIVVSDLHGMLPLFGDHIPSIVDARTRLLASGGALIPSRDTLWAYPVESPTRYAERVEFWSSGPFGLDLSPARSLAANSWWRADAGDKALANAELLATFDYKRIDSPNLAASAAWVSERDGTFNGFSVWFDSILYDDIGFTNAPGRPETIYGQGFFPLDRPIEIRAGDSLALDFAATLVGGEYIFRWVTNVTRSGRVPATFTQSTLHSFPLSPAQLARLDEQHKPVLTQGGEAVSYLLENADGDHTIRELGERLHDRFPSLFRSRVDAVRFATEQSLKYCR